MPLFSVVIPLYNKGPHIKRAIDSVLTQKIQDFEIVIVDDGSTDNSAEIVKNFADTRIRLIQQENFGVSAARNKGIKEAKADLIALLDADDEWTPSFLETILRLIEKYPEAGAYATALDKSRNGKIEPSNYKEIPPAPWEGKIPNYFLAGATGDSPVCSSTVCIPKKIFRELGTFPVGSQSGEDLDMWGRIALKYPIAFSWSGRAIYYEDSVNKLSLKKAIIKEPFIERAQKAIKEGKVPKNEIYFLKEYIARFQLIAAYNHIVAGKNNEALKIIYNCETKLHQRKKIELTILALMPNSIYRFVIKIKNYKT